MLSFTKLSLIGLLSLASVVMASGNKDGKSITGVEHVNNTKTPVIVSFQKGTSDEDRNNAVKDLQAKGAKIVKDENLHSKIMPYVLVNVDEQQFADVQSSFTGHSVVKHVEEDKQMHTQ